MAFEIWKDGVRTGLLEGYDSIQWLTYSRDYGEFQITASNPTVAALLGQGTTILNTDTMELGSVEYVKPQVDASGCLSVEARGYNSIAMLDRRVVMGTVTISNIEDAMIKLYTDNQRGLSLLPPESNGYDETADSQITWNSILDAWKKLAELAKFGFGSVFDRLAGTNTLRIYKGVDRSDDRSANYSGVFGDRAGNLTEISLARDASKYKNVAIVGGVCEGANRVVRIVGSASGDDRRELWVDAKDLQKTYQIATPTGKYDSQGNPEYNYTEATYTEEEYAAALDRRGVEKLLDCLNTQSVSCTVIDGPMRFGVNYNLEDRVPVVCKDFLGLRMSARVSGVKLVYEDNARKVYPILSDFEQLRS